MTRAGLLALAFAMACVGCADRGASTGAQARTPWLPGFAARESAITTLTVRAAGDRAAVTLHRTGKQWRIAERAGWPADTARVETLLADLAAARRFEAKTTQPDRYHVLSVQPIADAASTGVRVDLAGGGAPLAVLLGKAKGQAQRFVRIDGDAQAWLVDRPLVAPADPAQWLDLRLVDVPLARIARVDVSPDSGQSFALTHRDDRFRIEGVPSSAMGDSHAGDALAGVLDQLRFDDVARDEGGAAPERTVRFSAHDGSWLELAAWRVDGNFWVRVDTSAQGELARALAQPQATEGWRFRLPAMQASMLMASRTQILEAAP